VFLLLLLVVNAARHVLNFKGDTNEKLCILQDNIRGDTIIQAL
jgi:hypothetical protein